MGAQGVIANAVYVFTYVLKLLVFLRVITSWFTRANFGGGIAGGIMSVIFTLTEPVLGSVRRMMTRSPVAGVNTILDFSPIFSYFLIDGCSSMLIEIINII